MNTTSSLEFGAETNSSCELDDRGLVCDLLGLGDCGLDAFEVSVTFLDVQSMPAVGLEPLQDILGEGALGVTICGFALVSEILPEIAEILPIEMWLSS
jgi:hypothetical protein